jgi:hypothetical protein
MDTRLSWWRFKFSLTAKRVQQSLGMLDAAVGAKRVGTLVNGRGRMSHPLGSSPRRRSSGEKAGIHSAVFHHRCLCRSSRAGNFGGGEKDELLRMSISALVDTFYRTYPTLHFSTRWHSGHCRHFGRFEIVWRWLFECNLCLEKDALAFMRTLPINESSRTSRALSNLLSLVDISSPPH